MDRKKIVSILHQTLIITVDVVSVVSVVILLLSAFNWAFTPKEYPYLSSLRLVFPLLVIFHVLIILIWIIMRKWIAAVALAVPLLVAINPIRTTFPISIFTPSVSPTDSTLSVMTYNCFILKDFSNPDNNVKMYKKERNITIDEIMREGSDIVCLQECHVHSITKRLGVGKQQMSELKALYPYQLHSGYDNQILSKYPIIDYIDISNESEEYSATKASILIGNDTISLYNLHLQSFHFTNEQKKAFRDATSKQNIKEVASGNINKEDKRLVTNLVRIVADMTAIRIEQANRIKTFISQDKHPVIICGDWNDVICSETYKTLASGLTDVHKAVGNGLSITFHADHFFFRIDHIICDQNYFTPLSLTVLPWTFSDHYPQVAKFKIR